MRALDMRATYVLAAAAAVRPRPSVGGHGGCLLARPNAYLPCADKRLALGCGRRFGSSLA